MPAALTREQVAQIYRPIGPKRITTGNAWTAGGSYSLSQGVDLSLPIRGLRFVFKGRVVVGTAGYTSYNPLGILNLINRILVTGTNARQSGNVTLCDMSLATAWLMGRTFDRANNVFLLNSSNVSEPSTAFPTGYFSTNTGNFDFYIVCDVPFHPHAIPVIFRPAFGVRQDEWGKSMQIQLTYGSQADNADGALGVSAATTATSFKAYGSATGNPTVDIYSLPYEMGLDLKDSAIPGVLSRVGQPITSPLQSSGGPGATLLQLQAQDTTRIFALIGTSTTNPYLATVSDAIVTALGLTVGGNRVVREEDDIFAHKQDYSSQNRVPIIQGVNVLDFIQSGSPFSAYPGSAVGNGTQFNLTGTVTGTANAYGIIIQEQMLYKPSGALYANAGSNNG